MNMFFQLPWCVVLSVAELFVGRVHKALRGVAIVFGYGSLQPCRIINCIGVNQTDKQSASAFLFISHFSASISEVKSDSRHVLLNLLRTAACSSQWQWGIWKQGCHESAGMIKWPRMTAANHNVFLCWVLGAPITAVFYARSSAPWTWYVDLFGTCSPQMISAEFAKVPPIRRQSPQNWQLLKESGT